MKLFAHCPYTKRHLWDQKGPKSLHRNPLKSGILVLNPSNEMASGNSCEAQFCIVYLFTAISSCFNCPFLLFLLYIVSIVYIETQIRYE